MRNKITDEQLLSYILGDCSSDLKTTIEETVKSDPALEKRLDVLNQIQKQIRVSPFQCYVPVQKKIFTWKLAVPVCSLIILSFIFGLFIESQFIFFNHQTVDNLPVTTETIISKPVNWDESRFLSLM